MKQIKWFSRVFNFDSSQNTFPSIIERLSGTPIRLEEKLRNVAEHLLNQTPENSWSIKENVGHLIDLEPLWQERFVEILNGKPEMKAADLENRKTNIANHNNISINKLLADFRMIRHNTLEMIENLTEEEVFKYSLHPRLKSKMRTIDLFLFVAEHDDHHLARISELIKKK